MSIPYLEISFRHGRPFAAYIHCRTPIPAVTTKILGHGLVLDCADDGSVIGVEITAPQQVDAMQVSRILSQHGIEIPLADLAPLAA